VIGIAYQGGSTQLPFTLCVFRGKDMTLVSHGPFDLSGPGLFKPFGCATVGLHFRHNLFFTVLSQGTFFTRILHPDAAGKVTSAWRQTCRRAAGRRHDFKFLLRILSECRQPALFPATTAVAVVAASAQAFWNHHRRPHLYFASEAP